MVTEGASIDLRSDRHRVAPVLEGTGGVQMKVDDEDLTHRFTPRCEIGRRRERSTSVTGINPIK